jgi:phospholipase D1/2
MLEEWKKYLTVLNVRNYGATSGGKVVSEMIYVHSKLTIVDDAVAIIGSANINDRSLNGNGDTEIAAVVVDDAQAGLTDVGNGVKCITRQFAKDLRKKLWQKHLGMLVDQTTTGVQKSGIPSGINLDKPLDTASIKGIQKLADKNRSAYNEVFLHTARDSYGTLSEGRIKGYTFQYKDRGGNVKTEFSTSTTPNLQPAYMDANGGHKVKEATVKLNSEIKGFWVSMPLDWGSNERETPKPPQNMPQLIAQENNRIQTQGVANV